MPLAHAVEVNAITLDGEGGPELSAHWSWAPRLVSEAAARGLAAGWFRALAGLVGCVAAGAGGRSPSDVALAALTQDEIERLERAYPRLEDILPLSPLQEGLLFHALYDARAPDVYTVQLELALSGPLDVGRLEAAAQALVGRHASLRACFADARLRRPVQVIMPPLAAPWRLLDLSGLDTGARAARLADILAEDRGARFDLAVAPLLRWTLVRLGASEHRLALTNHHLLIDGWSSPVLVQELLALYAAGTAEALPRVTPYRDYLGFIAAQDRTAGLAAWREALAGLEAGTRLAPSASGLEPAAPEQLALTLSEPLTAALSELGRRQGVTLNTLIQAVWAILLGRLTGRDDVVFGVTVAGRPPEIAGIERMVGLFINTLPLRVRLAPATPLTELLHAVQESQSRLMAHAYVGLAEIQQLAGVGELFDTLTVFENYPVEQPGGLSAGGLRAAPVGGHDATHYPLSLAVVPGAGLGLRLYYRPDLFDRLTVDALTGRLVRLLEGAVGDPGRAISALEILSAAERRVLLHDWNDTARALPPTTLPGLFAAQAGADARGDCRRRGGRAKPELWGARGPRQPARPSSARTWGWARGCGGAVRGALRRDGGGAVGDSQGGRGLSAARPELSGGAARLHAGGCGGPGAGRHGFSRRCPAYTLSPDRAARRRRGRHRPPSRHRPAARPRSASSRLCHLHLGLDRPTQRRRR